VAVSPLTRSGGAARGDLSRDADGRDGVLTRRRVIDLQRARILASITEVVRERGVRSVAIAHIVARSGVSRRTFYDLFENREDCLVAAFERAVECATETVLPAYEAAGGWQERIRAGLEAALGFLDAEPAMGALCVVDALAAEGMVLERRARVVDALVDAVHEGPLAQRSAVDGGAKGKGGPPAGGSAGRGGSRARGPARQGGSRRPPRIVAEGAVGAVLAVIHARMVAADPKPLSDLLGPLTSMIVLPYLGPEEAERELARRPSRRRAAPAQPNGDLLRDLDIRLTYRTVRVLFAVSELGGRGPGPSGRQIADAAGVTDPGQMSKLLWRLAHLGLIANEARTLGRGEPNAWNLTSRGREVAQAIRAQAGF
jgi:AcrR family transcriptional regulator